MVIFFDTLEGLLQLFMSLLLLKLCKDFLQLLGIKMDHWMKNNETHEIKSIKPFLYLEAVGTQFDFI